MHVLSIIPARGKSKGLKRKNIRVMNGRPMIAYSIKASLNSLYVNRTVVSTEDEEIAGLAGEYGSEVILRPEELAGDDSTTLAVLQNLLQHLSETETYLPDIVVLLQPTSPLRTADDIDTAVQLYLDSECDSVVSVAVDSHPPQWSYIIENTVIKPLLPASYDKNRRQEFPQTYHLNGAIYVTNIKNILTDGRILGEETVPYIMPAERSVDIDTELDFDIAEFIMKRGMS